jgi:D-tyrosyl-tRNA(Tyr) deacylase
MRILVQRVRNASVSVDGNVVGSINAGLLAFVGITHSDTEATVHWMTEKLLTLRILSDAEGRMNLSLLDVGGGLLIVSQFTLYGDLAKGTRPSFVRASHPDHALPLYQKLLDELSETIALKGASVTLSAGIFGAMMDVSIVNHGPVTILLERT